MADWTSGTSSSPPLQPTRSVHDSADAALLRTSVFYDPHLFHYLSRGWDLDELLTRRVHTCTGVHVPLTLRLRGLMAGDAGAPAAGATVYRLAATQLRRAALRQVILVWEAEDEAEEGEADAGDGRVADGAGSGVAARAPTSAAHAQGTKAREDASLEEAVDRWLPLVHLRIIGGRHGSAAAAPAPPTSSAREREASAPPPPHSAGTACVVVLAGDGREPDTACEPAAPAGRPPPTSQDRIDAQQWPVLLTATTVEPASSTSSEVRAVSQQQQQPRQLPVPVLLLSFVEDAAAWRRLRRAARSAVAAPPAASATATAAAEEATRTATVSLFVSHEDRLFTQWLRARRLQRRAWRGGRREGTGLATRGAPAAEVGAAVLLSAVEVVADAEEDAARPAEGQRRGAPAVVTHDDPTDGSSRSSSSSGSDSTLEALTGGRPAPTTAEVADRRAAILAAIARRRGNNA